MIEAQDRASAALNAVAASLGRLEQQAGRTGTSLPKIATGMALGTVAAHAFMGAAQAVTGTLAGMGKGAIDLASRLEQAKIGFTTMLGGAQQADAFIRKLQAFAEGTAFSFPGIQQAAQSFLAMGIDAKNVIPIITDVTNALAAAGKGGNADALQRVGASLAEVSAQGKITGEQLRELSRNGIAVLPILAAAFGKTTAEIQKMAEEGEISASMFFEAFHSQVAQRYGDIQAEQAKTWAVAITNVQDILGRMTVETLAEFFGALTKGALLLQDFLKSDRAAAWADDMKQAIHAVMVALEPLGAALQGVLGGGGNTASTAPKPKPPVEAAKAMIVSPEAIKSAKDYDAQIKAATADIHGATAALTALTAQQDALKITIQDTKAGYEATLEALQVKQEALNVEIEQTKAKWEAVIAPLERTQQQLGRLAEDTKADFAAIMDPLKAGLDVVNRRIQDAKANFESVVRPIQSQIDAIDKANAALVKQRNLVNEIADLALRQKSLQALGDPGLRADIAGKLKLLDLARNELEWKKQLIELDNKGKDADKATESVQKQLDANTRERIALERQLQGAADKGLLAQVESQGVLNDAKKEQTEIDLANARIAADAQKAPLEAQVELLKAMLASTLAPLEAHAAALSRAIENTAASEAAALAPIIAAQASVARQIEDANTAMQEALAPLEAASKAIGAEIKATEAAQRAALAPLEAQGKELERQRDVLELRKKQISDNVAAWKDEAAAIKVAAEEAAKIAKALDLSGGEDTGASPGDPTGTSPLAQFPRPEPATVTAFRDLATNVQASADAFNNLNVATSGGLVGSLAGLVQAIGTFVVAGVITAGLAKLAAGFRGLAGPAGLAQLALTGVLLVFQNFPQISAALAVLGKDVQTFFDGQQRNIDALKQNWTIFWQEHIKPVLDFWAQYGPKTAEQQAIDKAAWAAHQAAQKAAHDKFWADLINPVAAWWTSLGAKTAEQQAADKAAWEAHQKARTESWNKFWDGLAAKVAAWKLDWTAGWLKIWADWDRDWAKIVNAPQAGWKTFTDWLFPAVDGVVAAIDPIAKVFERIGETIANLPKTLPDWWTQRPGWMGGTGGAQNISLRTGGGSPYGNIQGDYDAGAGLSGDNLLKYVFNAFTAALGAEAGRAAAAVALTEGGLYGAVGDEGMSHGVFQFYGGGGQLNNFAKYLNTSLEEAANIATNRPDIAVQYALENYLGKTIADGLAAGLTGPDLATYAQRYGQVSISPERAGQSYNTLFGPGGAMPETTVDMSGGVSGMQDYLLATQNVTAAQLQLADSSGVVQQAQAQADAATANSQAGLEQIMVPTAQLTEAQAAAAAQAATFAAQSKLLSETLSGQAPATTTATTALTSMNAAIGEIERQVAAGSISAETLQFKLLDLARATGLNTEAWAAFDSGAATSTVAMEQLIRQSAGLGPQFQAIATYLDSAGASSTEAALQFLQAIIGYQKITPAVTAVGAATDKTAAETTQAATAVTALAGQFTDLHAPISESTTLVKAFETAVAAIPTAPLKAQVSAWNSVAEAIHRATEQLKEWEDAGGGESGGDGPSAPSTPPSTELLGQIGFFAKGGRVPGPIGAPTLAVVHGGELVIPPGQIGRVSGGGASVGGQTVVVNLTVNGDMLSEIDWERKVANAVSRQARGGRLF